MPPLRGLDGQGSIALRTPQWPLYGRRPGKILPNCLANIGEWVVMHNPVSNQTCNWTIACQIARSSPASLPFV